MKLITLFILFLSLLILTTSSQVMASDAPQFTCNLSYTVYDLSKWEEKGFCPRSMAMTCAKDGDEKTSENTSFRPGYQKLELESIQENMRVILYNDYLVENKRVMAVTITQKYNHPNYNRSYPRRTVTFYVDLSLKGQIFNMYFPIEGKETDDSLNIQYRHTNLSCKI